MKRGYLFTALSKADRKLLCNYCISAVVVCLETKDNVHKEVSLMQKVCCLAEIPENLFNTPLPEKGYEEKY